MVARILAKRTNLPISAWGDAISDATMLILLQPTATQSISAVMAEIRQEERMFRSLRKVISGFPGL